MPSSTSNRFFVLSGEDPDPRDVRLEMEDLQGPNRETEQTQISEVRDVSVSNVMTCLTASAYDFQLDRGSIAEEIQVSSKATEIGEASSTKGSELSIDEVRTLRRRVRLY